MELRKIFYLCILVFLIVYQCMLVGSQRSGIELPVQLVGFPFIVLAVRITNFVKKLSYAVSPATYRSRSRRELPFIASSLESLDVQDVEKYITAEYGSRACVFERICTHYATQAQAQPRPEMDWPEVFSQYKKSQNEAKEMYLFSVFLGDIVGSPQLCHQLAKRRPCDEALLG